MKSIILMFLINSFRAIAGNTEVHLVNITRKDNGDVTRMFYLLKTKQGSIVKLRVASPKRTQYVVTQKNLKGKGRPLMSKIGIKILSI